ncbi:hypothetical protein AAMO2058_001059900 [Amorphochlora amoebiformis]
MNKKASEKGGGSQEKESHLHAPRIPASNGRTDDAASPMDRGEGVDQLKGMEGKEDKEADEGLGPGDDLVRLSSIGVNFRKSRFMDDTLVFDIGEESTIGAIESDVPGTPNSLALSPYLDAGDEDDKTKHLGGEGGRKDAVEASVSMDRAISTPKSQNASLGVKRLSTEDDHPQIANSAAGVSMVAVHDPDERHKWVELDTRLQKGGFPALIEETREKFVEEGVIDSEKARRTLEDVLEAHADRGSIIAQYVKEKEEFSRSFAADAEEKEAREMARQTQAKAQAERKTKDVLRQLTIIKEEKLDAEKRSKAEIRNLTKDNASLRTKLKTMEVSVRAQKLSLEKLRAKFAEKLAKKSPSRHTPTKKKPRVSRTPSSVRSQTRSSPRTPISPIQDSSLRDMHVAELRKRIIELQGERDAVSRTLENTHRRLEDAYAQLQDAQSATVADGELKQQLEALRAEVEQVERENFKLRQRPTHKEFHQLQNTVWELNKKLQGEMQDVPQQGNVREMVLMDKSEHRDGFCEIPKLSKAVLCKHLMDICRLLEISHPQRLLPSLRKILRVLGAVPSMETFIRQVCEKVVGTPTPENRTLAEENVRDRERRAGVRKVLPTLETWISKIRTAKRVESVVEDILFENGLKLPESQQISFDRKVEMLRRLLPSEKKKPARDTNAEEKNSEMLPQQIVGHFMHLFEVETISGIYPKINDLFLKHNETENLLRNLREGLNPNHNLDITLTQL